jgi:hypothetical protein
VPIHRPIVAPLYPPIIGPMGGGLPWDRGGGAPAAWSPATSSAVLEYWTFDDLTPGLIDSWVGKKLGTNLASAGALRPTASATSFNSMPGLTSTASGMSAPLNLSANSTLRLVCGLVDATNALALPFEYTANSGVGNGGFYIATCDTAADSIGCNLRNTGSGNRRATETLVAPRIISIGFDFSLNTGVRFIRSAGVSQALTTVSSACVAGFFANSSLYLMSRGADGATFPWAGVMGGALMIMSGIAEDADLTSAELYASTRAGL